MPEIFDMIAGSETGAMIASSLVIPNDNPLTKDTQINKYFADTTSSFFWNFASSLYVDQEMPWLLNLMIKSICIALISGVTYYCLHRKYKLKPGYQEKIDNLQQMISKKREQKSDENIEHKEHNDKIQSLLEKDSDLVLHKIMITV